MSSSGNKVDYVVELRKQGYSPEEIFLIRLIKSAQESLKRAITSTKKSEIVEAIEDYRWFFFDSGNTPRVPLECSSFESVCHALDILPDSIRNKMIGNPEFPSFSLLRTRLQEIARAQRNKPKG